MSKVVALLSGGVDSSYTAYLLKNSGYTPVGVYLKLHKLEGYHEKNIANAKRVCEALGIEFYVLDLQSEFERCVYLPFVDGYIDGLTPNPCVMCNPNIKFKKSLEFADSLGIGVVASGHYVINERGFLHKAKDLSKDQSYFLYRMPKEYLPRIIFPLGERLKSDLKKEALEIPLLKEIATQKESQEICFVEDDYTDIIRKHTEIDIAGSVLDTNGNIVGKHKGYMHYTIGKRKGFSIKGAHEPHYVLSIDAKQNVIVVGKREDLAKKSVTISNINLFCDKYEFDAQVKIRYRAEPTQADVKIDGDIGNIEFKEPVYGVAKGQSAVFYDGDRVLGGGIIL